MKNNNANDLINHGDAIKSYKWVNWMGTELRQVFHGKTTVLFCFVSLDIYFGFP